MFALLEQAGDGPSTAKLNSLGNIFLPVFWAGLLVSQSLSFSVSLALSAQQQLNLDPEGYWILYISAEQSFPPGQGWDGASGIRVVPSMHISIPL